MPMKIRVGLVGLGPNWEQRHRPALLASSDRFEVSAVCDQVAHRAEQVARDFKAEVCDGYFALARRGDVDAIMMLSRQWYGVLPIMAACDAGKSIYCASGWDLNDEEINTVRERVLHAGISLSPEFPNRHSPATLRLKELIATKLGPPSMLFCHQRLVKEQDKATKHFCPPHDHLRHNLVELIDWCCFVVGRDPSAVWGVKHPVEGEVSGDYEMMSLDFSSAQESGKNKVVAQISSGRYMSAKWTEAVSFRPPSMLQVVCQNGVAFVDLPSSLTWFDSFGRQMESLDSERPPFEQLLSQFHRSVTNLVRDRSGIDDLCRAVHVSLAARKANESGLRQPLADVMASIRV